MPISCIKNSSDKDRVAKVATARAVDLDVFNVMMLKKKKILNKEKNSEYNVF